MKGSAFIRTVTYFRTADLTEAQACLNACTKAVDEREGATAIPKKRRGRRPKAAPPADLAQGASA